MPDMHSSLEGMLCHAIRRTYEDDVVQPQDCLSTRQCVEQGLRLEVLI